MFASNPEADDIDEESETDPKPSFNNSARMLARPAMRKIGSFNQLLQCRFQNSVSDKSPMDAVMDHVEKANKFCMIRNEGPVVKVPGSPSANSCMDSRGDYPTGFSSSRSNGGDSNSKYFSFNKLRGHGGGFSHINLGTNMSDVESVNENLEDGQFWCTGPDGLHKHSFNRDTDQQKAVKL